MPPPRRIARLHEQLAPACTPAAAATEPSSSSPPIFRHVDVNVEKYHRDGYMAFPGIMTPEATAECLAALKRLQARSDSIIMNTDWNGLDWGALGSSRGWPAQRRFYESRAGTTIV